MLIFAPRLAPKSPLFCVAPTRFTIPSFIAVIKHDITAKLTCPNIIINQVLFRFVSGGKLC